MTSMTTGTLAAEVLDEAECVVRAEWLRLYTAATPEHCDAGAHRLPVSRPRPPKLAVRSAEPRRRGAPPPSGRDGRAGGAVTREVRPTQRSPPERHRTGPRV
ncbi:hypothetical protein MTER_09990 [Mycolicibacter terrae]|uniref:Uncharacterized protein n=1 Tax=Mycolicibacter terrae TaxID=1788 RepID=A0AAD1HW35_9MYCO|nr:hypothetical protein MTER_09990 [Mycolicibacter terrae]